MNDTEQPAVFVYESAPDWGFGIVLEDRPDKWVLLFEKGGKRIFMKHLVKGLKTAELNPDDARAVDARIRGRRPPQSQGPSKGSKQGKKSALLPTQAYASFEDQLRWFEKEFVGGFEGERFITEERGREDIKGKNGYKAAAMVFAREELAPERFKTAGTEDLFETARRMVGFTNIVHPMEGAIAFGSMKDEARASFVTALGEMLHGTGDYGARLDRFIGAVRIFDAEGKAKKVTWPLATLFSAMYHPNEHVCVKPTYFEQQAPIVGLSANKSQPPSGKAYTRFLDVARATQARLLSAGHCPRDMMDVYSFIWLSHSYKPAPSSP